MSFSLDFSSLFTIFTYVACGYGIMCIGKTCGLKNPWLSWIPFANSYQTGVVADHYTARVQNRRTSSATLLLVLSIVRVVTVVICTVIMLVSLVGFLSDFGLDLWALLGMSGSVAPEDITAEITNQLMGILEDEAALMEMVLSLLATILIPALIMAAVEIVYHVFYFIALHRIYKLVDPAHSTAYTVLSIIFTNIATPIIFLIIAKKTACISQHGAVFYRGSQRRVREFQQLRSELRFGYGYRFGAVFHLSIEPQPKSASVHCGQTRFFNGFIPPRDGF